MQFSTRWAIVLGLFASSFASAGCATTSSPPPSEPAKTEQAEESSETEGGQVEGTARSVDLSIPDLPGPAPDPAGEFETVTVKRDEAGKCVGYYDREGILQTTHSEGAPEDCPWPEGRHEWGVPTDVRREIAGVVGAALTDSGPTDPLVKASVRRDWGTESVSITSEAGARITSLLKPEVQTTWLEMPGEIDEVAVSARVPEERLMIFVVRPNAHVRIMSSVPEGKAWLIKRERLVGLSEAQAKTIERAIQMGYAELEKEREDVSAGEQKEKSFRGWSFMLRGEDLNLSTSLRVPAPETPPRWMAEMIETLKEAAIHQ